MPPKEAIAYLKLVEQCRLTAYLDSEGIATIGWGQTEYLDGTRVKIGDRINQAFADSQLDGFLIRDFWPIVQRMPGYKIMSDGLRSALTNFCYNTGYSFPKSNFDTLNRVLGNALGSELPKALMLYNKANGKPSLGLSRRRYGEILLSQGVTAQDAYQKAWSMLTVESILGEVYGTAKR